MFSKTGLTGKGLRHWPELRPAMFKYKASLIVVVLALMLAAWAAEMSPHPPLRLRPQNLRPRL